MAAANLKSEGRRRGLMVPNRLPPKRVFAFVAGGMNSFSLRAWI